MVWIAVGSAFLLALLVVAVLMVLGNTRRAGRADGAAAKSAVPSLARAQEERPRAATAAAPPTATAPTAAGPTAQAKQAADLVKVAITLSDVVVVDIINEGPRRMLDAVLAEVRHQDHPEWNWRPAAGVAGNQRMWWRIDPGQSARCCVELLAADEVVSPSPAGSGYSVRVFWSDTSGNWWVLTTSGLGASGQTPSAGPTTGPTPDELPRLTKAEDTELRQLTWFASVGQLSAESQARLAELKARDRRGSVRDARPDPVSRHADQTAARLPAAAPRATRCGNCGFEAHSAALPGFCPACGQSVITSQSHR